MGSQNAITNLLNLEKPIIQAGMIWCSGWKLASEISKNGALGTIGAGSMYPEILLEHITKMQAACDKPFAVNLPLLYPDIDKHIKTIIDKQVPVVITSAGSPKKYTSLLKENNIKVIHVVSSALFAKKSEDAGVDAVIAEGFEAGGHNGREETTTLCLIPKVAESVQIPIIAAGGISSGRSMLATMILGADGVQIGSRFVTATESSAHTLFKQRVLQTDEGDTRLILKKLAPVRLIKNEFHDTVLKAELNGSSTEDLQELLGRGRAKNGMFEGDLINGELGIGQVASLIKDIKPAQEILEEIWNEFCLLNGKPVY